MNIGIDFNTKTTKASFLVDGTNVENSKVFEIKNVLVFANNDIFSGQDGFNKFLTEKDSTIYDLGQINEWNGLIVNKKQISVEKCLSVIFSHLLDLTRAHVQQNEIDFICVSIPYDKFYYWHDMITKAFLLLNIQKLRIISQPTAFFLQPNIKQLHRSINQESINNERQNQYNFSQATSKYKELPWFKKILTHKPEYKEVNDSAGYLFVSISQDNMNASLVGYIEDMLEVKSTQYTNVFTRKKIENTVLDYFLGEIRKDPRKFVLKDQKTILRILEVVNELLKTPRTGNNFELNVPYVLCEDDEYRTLDTKIDLFALDNHLAPILNTLSETVKQLAAQTQEAQSGIKTYFQTKIDNVIVVGDPYLLPNIKDILNGALSGAKISFGEEKSLVIGALNFSRIMSGEKRDFLALEVIPFSILVRLQGGTFVEVIRKDTTLPTISTEQCFTITGENKSKYAEVHLTTKEGGLFQSLNVWKIQINDNKSFVVQVHVGVKLDIDLKAFIPDPSKGELLVRGGSTFSFSGSGLGVGIRGKDIRQYILNQFNYLSAVLKNDEVTIFEPNVTFYSMLKDGDPFKALRYLGQHLKLKSLPDVEMADSKFFEEQGIAGFIAGTKISIPKSFTSDPYGFGYVLAHELAHYLLIREEGIVLDDEQENEILTEIFVVYAGMGKLFLNGFKSKDIQSASPRSRGYLDDKIINYIHNIYFSKFSVNLTDYKNNLTKEAVKVLNDLASDK